MNEFAIFLGCHNRVTELLCHVDRLKFLHIPHDLHILYSGNQTLPFETIPFKPIIFPAVSAVINALRIAKEKGYKYLLYNNGDDWMFRNDLVESRLEKLKKYSIVGYNWFGKNNLRNIAINELYLRVNDFDIEERQNKHHVIEDQMADFLKLTESNFYRLHEREHEKSIGNQFDTNKNPMNNRVFCKYWHLLTSHNPRDRYKHYNMIRHQIPYHEELEQQTHFKQWIDTNKDNVFYNIYKESRTLLPVDKLYYLNEKCIQTKDIPGDVAELGCYKGGSLKLMASLLPGKIIHAYDTFAGMPYNDAYGEHKKGEFKITLEEVKSYVGRTNVRYHKGIFPETAVDVKYSLVHVDGDIYQSTIAAIDYFWPRLSDGGWMVFDDYEWYKTEGVKRAVMERFKPEQIVTYPESKYQCFVEKNQ